MQYLITITRERTTNSRQHTTQRLTSKTTRAKKYGDTNTACVLPRLERELMREDARRGKVRGVSYATAEASGAAYAAAASPSAGAAAGFAAVLGLYSMIFLNSSKVTLGASKARACR